MAKEFILIDLAAGASQAFFKSDKLTRVSLGRVEGVNVIIRDSTVSRSHAEFLSVGSEWVIRDLGSTNGTMVNGLLLPEHEFYLMRSGDVIQFGDIEFEFSIPGEKSSGRDYAGKAGGQTPTLFVFKAETYQGEFPIGPSTDFTFGGSKPTIMSSELGTEELIFIIRQQEDGQLILSTKHPEHRPIVNGEKQGGRFSLNDRDTIKIASLYILASQPHSPANAASSISAPLSDQINDRPGHSLRVRQDTVPMDTGLLLGESPSIGGGFDKGMMTTGTGFTKVRPGEIFSEYEGESRLKSHTVNEDNFSESGIPEMPDYLQNRIGQDGWEDPLKQRQRAGTSTLFKFDEAAEQEREKIAMRTGGAINRSQADLVGVKRFSSPNLTVVKAEEERKNKMLAIIGFITLLVMLAMLVILLDMYYLSIK